MTFKDHFSKQSSTYSGFRPDYPPALYDYIFEHCSAKDLAWDCACGTGQAARGLAKAFHRVVASDASQGQLEQAEGPANVCFECFPAENSPFENQSVDLISVAQALHWFERGRFFDECKRVLRPRGLLAVWTYGPLEINPEADEIVYQGELAKYWPPERQLVEDSYKDIEFPFERVDRINEFEIKGALSLEQVLGYIKSWSAYQSYLKVNPDFDWTSVKKDLQPHWGRSEFVKVRWPITLILASDV